jgi:hypothetical protein
MYFKICTVVLFYLVTFKHNLSWQKQNNYTEITHEFILASYPVFYIFLKF